MFSTPAGCWCLNYAFLKWLSPEVCLSLSPNPTTNIHYSCFFYRTQHSYITSVFVGLLRFCLFLPKSMYVPWGQRLHLPCLSGRSKTQKTHFVQWINKSSVLYFRTHKVRSWVMLLKLWLERVLIRLLLKSLKEKKKKMKSTVTAEVEMSVIHRERRSFSSQLRQPR